MVNCISVSQLCETGVNVLFKRDGAIIMKGDKILGKGYVDGGVYLLSMSQECAGGIDMLRETMGLMTVTDHLDEHNNPCAWGWYLNTKTNLHMCNSREMFVDYRPVSDEEVNFAENDCVKVAGIGTVMVRFTTGKVLTLSNVCHAPKINKCLVSVSELDGNGFSMVFGGGEVVIKKSDEIMGKGYKQDGSYRLMTVTDRLEEDNNPWARGWYLDSKTNSHMCNSREMFVDYHPVHDEQVDMGENDSVKVVGIGTVMFPFTTGKVLTLSNVCYAPTINKCLVSVCKLDDIGFSMVFGGGEVVIKMGDEILGKGYKQGGSYRLSIIGQDPKSVVKAMHEEEIGLITNIEGPVLSNLRRRGWYLASRCTVHVCNSRDMFTNYQAWSGHEVILDNNEHVEVAGTGTVKLRFTTGKILTLTNVFHMPTIKKCLLSLGKLTPFGFSMCSEGREIIIKKDNMIVGKGYNEDGLMRLSIVDEHQGRD